MIDQEHPRLDISQSPVSDDDDAARVEVNSQIEAFAATLEPDTWFQVWYDGTDETNYDVVRVDADGIHTLEVLTPEEVSA